MPFLPQAAQIPSQATLNFQAIHSYHCARKDPAKEWSNKIYYFIKRLDAPKVLQCLGLNLSLNPLKQVKSFGQGAL